ncbi:Gfo/Idh/MocA family oxidoreductase [Pedobacter sp. Hv1]|uniref:Gfo/Idh/MocA family oxidoreductase n=1 Tax=Pedobacter sp. Hv1 TaxID=1740090 RepID=UPI0006D8921C|nr:Gfo/Idh/MocA family oxidoreductase [Pedobacter sp. Hv1]KQB99390.1 oxidoreductase [Pedobacter sp. Hv1]
MNSKINTGLLAYGMSGKVFHAPFIDSHPGFNLVAITERNQKKAVHDYPSIKSYNSVEALLADESIELVIINSPNYTHYEYAKLALKAGKHILVEKPFTATTAQAKELFDLAKSVGKKAMVYQNRRFDSGFNSTKKIIESGKLGKLVEVHFRFDRYRNEIGPKAFKEEPVEASGLQYDLGPHLLDQAIALFGKPVKYDKILSKNRIGTKVDDYFFIRLSYPNELHVFLTASMLVVDVKDAFVLNGTMGSFSKNHADVQEAQLLKGMKPTDVAYGIEDPNDAGKLTLIVANGDRTTEFIPSAKGDYTGLFEAVYQNLVHDIPYPITEEDILAQLEILEAEPS